MKNLVKILAIIIGLLLLWTPIKAQAALTIDTPSAILIEKRTGKILYEKDADTHRSPASITKIMTLYLIFEGIEDKKIAMSDSVFTSAHAKSMGGSQVFLEEGESQTLDTIIKCITVASGNDSSVAAAEHLCGSEEEFVKLMNETAKNLGMSDSHFVDCCGLSDSDDHYMSARDVSIISRALISEHEEIFDYTNIWMEDITHTTVKGSTPFTLSSTNKLLKLYQWTTGLKTGSTGKAKYCISATAKKDGVELIAVIMGAPDNKTRFTEAIELLNYGFAICNLYVDENNDELPRQDIIQGKEETVGIAYESPFEYVDTEGTDMSGIEKELSIKANIIAPVYKGETAGEVIYKLNGKKIGSVPVVYTEDVEKASFGDYLKKAFFYYKIG